VELVAINVAVKRPVPEFGVLGVMAIIVKKLNSLKHLVRTTVAESHN